MRHFYQTLQHRVTKELVQHRYVNGTNWWFYVNFIVVHLYVQYF